MLLGPTLIHKHRDQEAFSNLANSMIRLKQSLARILAVGCDRHKAIKNGLTPHFHSAVFLACKRHFEDDIQRKVTTEQKWANLLLAFNDVEFSEVCSSSTSYKEALQLSIF